MKALFKDSLIVIPARKGSKGLPSKNKRLLGTKPLIQYTIEFAREIASNENICVSTNDEDIVALCDQLKCPVPFMRPAELASDSAAMWDVLVHAWQECSKNPHHNFQNVILLQPTTPYRNPQDFFSAKDMFDQEKPDMLIGVKEAKANPYFVLFEENNLGYLEKSKKGLFATRQNCPTVYQVNGALYIMSKDNLLKNKMWNTDKLAKYLLKEELFSIDIDTPYDWLVAQALLPVFLNFKKEGIIDYTCHPNG